MRGGGGRVEGEGEGCISLVGKNSGFFSPPVFFLVATFSFWDMVDFVYDRPYTKFTISQKLKVIQKKLLN